MEKGFIELTDKNYKNFKMQINEGKGKILLYEAGYRSFYPRDIDDAVFQLFFNHEIYEYEDPALSPRLYSKRNLKKNREYWLRRQPKTEGDLKFIYSIFEKLTVWDYWLEIKQLYVTDRGLFGKGGKTLYIPKDESIEETLKYAFSDMVGKINDSQKKNNFAQTGLGKKEIEEMVSYAINDLKTGSILKHNTQAGMDADCILGIG